MFSWKSYRYEKFIIDILKKLIFLVDSRQYQNTGKLLLSTYAMKD